MENFITFDSNIREWSASMRAFERDQVPFATASALTQTAKDMKGEHVTLLPLVFDRPTRFTINSLMVTPATKSKLSASVFFKEDNRQKYGKHYLMPQVQGGARPHKRFEFWLIKRGVMMADEYAVPARGLRLDSFGNVSAGTIVQILSQLAAGPDATQWETKASKKRAGSKRARYFVPQLGSNLARGIWRHNGKKIEPVLMFVKSVRYGVRYRFFDISRDAAEVRMPLNFDVSMNRAIASAKGR
jgi:hypothetical protein